ncbi:MAG: cytochrome c [Nitrospira sp.]
MRLVSSVVLLTLTIAGVLSMPPHGKATSRSASDRMAKGKQVYLKHCAGCHGSEGKGDGYKLLGADPANLTSPATQHKSDAALLTSIHEGKATMPSWNIRLSQQDARDVLVYVRTLAK